MVKGREAEVTFTGRGRPAATARLLCLALAVGCIAPVPAQQNPYPPLPGEPAAPTAEDARYMSSEEAVKAAYDFAMQAKDPDSDKLVDSTIAVISIGYPPAGAVLGFAWGLVKSGRTSTDPVGDALKLISTRLDRLNGRVDELDHQIKAVRDFAYKQANINRMRELKDRRHSLQVLLDRMARRPTGQQEKDEIASEARRLADLYLDTADEERDLWTWNDRLRVYSDPRNPGKLTGELLPAAFKPVPTLEFYIATLAFFMTAIEYQANGNRQFVINTYGKDLLRHASLLSVRPYWRELDEPPADDHLPEWLMAGITCDAGPVSKYPDEDGACSWASYCTDQFALKYRALAATGTFQGPSDRTDLCIWDRRELPKVDEAQRSAARQPANLVYGSDALATVETRYVAAAEEEIQRNWGLGAMTVMADQAVRLATHGTVQEQYIGKFDMTSWRKQFLYAINPVGELVWQAALTGEDRNGPQPRAAGLSSPARVTGRIASAASDHATRAADAVGNSGRLSASGRFQPVPAASGGSGRMAAIDRAKPAAGTPAGGARPAAGNAVKPVTDAAGSGGGTATGPHAKPSSVPGTPAPKWIHQWEGPRTVNTGWQNFTDVFPAGYGATGSATYGFSLFGLTRDGTLKWYRHDGFANGTDKWSAPVDVGTGWNSFKKVFAGGDGVMYTIGADGTLRWYRYQDVLEAKRPPRWAGPTVVASGWGGLTHAFSGGLGVIYTVKPDGTLVWWRHVSYQNGIDPAPTPAPGHTGLGRVAARWEGPKVVGSGWQGFRKIFSPGDGIIYAVNGAGELFWYYHQGFKDGSNAWQGPTKIASDWGNYRVMFPLMWGTPQPTSGIK